MKCGWLNHWAFYLDTTPNSQGKWNTGDKLNISLTKQLLVSICCAILLDVWGWFWPGRECRRRQTAQPPWQPYLTARVVELLRLPWADTETPSGRRLCFLSMARWQSAWEHPAKGRDQVNLWDFHSICTCAALDYFKAQCNRGKVLFPNWFFAFKQIEPCKPTLKWALTAHAADLTKQKNKSP